MADEYNDSKIEQQIEPYPGLKSLDKLLGTWKVSGPDIEGQVTYEWRKGLARVLQGQVQRRRQHECRVLGVSRRRRVRLDHDQSQGGALIAG